MQELFDTCLGGSYNRHLRPMPDCSLYDCTHRTRIFVGLSFRKLLKLDHLQGTLSMVVWLRLFWPDYRLRYNASRYFQNFDWDSDTDCVQTDESEVWVPPIHVYNMLARPTRLIDSPGVLWFDEQKLQDREYNMFQQVPLIINSLCNVYLTRFPFDVQVCTIELGDWATSEQFYTLHPRNEFSAELAMPEANAEFDVIKVEQMSTTHVSQFDEAAIRYPTVVYKLHLKRRPHYYLLKFVMPMLVLVLFGQALYWMDLNKERLSTGITLVLAVMTISFLLEPMMPKTKDVMWLEEFQVGCYILTCFPTFVSILLDHASVAGVPWRDRVDVVARAVHPLVVLAFFLFMFYDVEWPLEELFPLLFFGFNIVIYVLFASLGLWSVIKK
mmetsp:Transcript_88073/g.244472  ORF Transcript_88073/g.244472 Transcript_88073/m.244472 type:complete len:384 (+) Transcript_88073:258-1409(+)